MEEVLGRSGLGVLLDYAHLEAYKTELPPDNLERQFDFAYFAALSEALEEMYGERGGRGMALRVGRACFAHGMRSFGVLAGMGDPVFRAEPLDRRIVVGLDALARVFTNFTDQRTSVEDHNTQYRMIVDESPMAWQRQASRPVCHALTGIIQEALRWASNGYEFHVQEIECRATGHSHCVFAINKQPLGRK